MQYLEPRRAFVFFFWGGLLILTNPTAPRVFLAEAELGVGGVGSFRNLGVPCFGLLIIRILLFSVLYQGPLFSETPFWSLG